MSEEQVKVLSLDEIHGMECSDPEHVSGFYIRVEDMERLVREAFFEGFNMGLEGTGSPVSRFPVSQTSAQLRAMKGGE